MGAAEKDCSDEWVSLLLPIVTVKLEADDGTVIEPRHCNKSSGSGTPCCFIDNGAITKKKPVYTPSGPVVLRIRRLRCQVHDGDFQFKPSFAHCLEPETYFNPAVVRLGKVSV